MIHCFDQLLKPRPDKKQTNLLGRLATISSGNARPRFGSKLAFAMNMVQLHYVQVEPEFGELEFQSQITSHSFKKVALHSKENFKIQSTF